MFDEPSLSAQMSGRVEAWVQEGVMSPELPFFLAALEVLRRLMETSQCPLWRKGSLSIFGDFLYLVPVQTPMGVRAPGEGFWRTVGAGRMGSLARPEFETITLIGAEDSKGCAGRNSFPRERFGSGRRLSGRGGAR